MKKFLNKLIILQLLLSLIFIGILYYLYKVRIVEQVVVKDVMETIEDNSLSNLEAELKSIESLVKPFANSVDLIETKYISTLEQADSNKSNLLNTFKYTSLEITKVNELALNVIPVLFTEETSTIENLTLVEKLIPVIESNNLKEIDIDISVVNRIASVDNFLVELYSKLTNKDLKINLGLPAKWSDIHNYGRLSRLTNYYLANASFAVINKYTNKIRLYAYEFTPITSSKAGPITNLEWANQVIRFYIYKGIDSKKIDLVINNRGYLWPDRLITDNYTENFVLDDVQIKIISFNKIEELVANNSKALTEYNFDDNILEVSVDGKKNILVYPKLSLIESLKESAKKYNLNGFIIKNF